MSDPQKAGDAGDPQQPNEWTLAALNLDAPPTRIVVIGGGIAGLVAARDCARPGFEVTLVETADSVGGCVASHEVSGIRLDSGAESFATRGGHVAALIEELGLGDRLATPNPEGAWVRLGQDSVPLPKAGLLGIPSSPLASDVIRAIGWSGALRAYADRVMPVLKIGQERSLGALVRKRMGSKVLDRLVAPVATGVYSASPDELDVAVVAPGLNQAITRVGSLSGAVAELRSAAKAGSAVAGIVGGMSVLVDELAADLTRRGGRILTGSRVTGLTPWAEPGKPDVPTALDDPYPFEALDDEIESIDENEATIRAESERGRDSEAVRGPDTGAAPGLEAAPALEAAPGLEAASAPEAASGREAAPEPDAEPEPAADRGVSEPIPAESVAPRSAPWKVTVADGRVLDADAVIVTVPGPVALELLKGVGEEPARLGALDWPDASSVELATLVVDVPELATNPRGTGVLVAEDATAVEAKALTHATAKWSWLAERAGHERHVVRLSYGRAGRTSVTASLNDDDFRELARRDAAELLGIPIPASAVLGFARTSWTNALPFAVVGERKRIADVRAAVHGIEGLEMTGAWLTGTGLASVVPDAREAARAARGLRWRKLAENN